MHRNAKLRESFIPPLWVLSLLTLLGVGWVLYTLKEMVILLVLSYSIAYVISPLIDWFERRSVSREVSVILVGVGFLVVFILALATTIPMLLREYHDLMGIIHTTSRVQESVWSLSLIS
jgi:predicted PurR-regulated permease PerM